MDESIQTISIRELINSGVLSTNELFFDHEIQANNAPGPPEYEKHRQILNSTKVSLLLAKSFLQLANDDRNKSYLPFLRLDDVFVTLKCPSNAAWFQTGGAATRCAGIARTKNLESVWSNTTMTCQPVQNPSSHQCHLPSKQGSSYNIGQSFSYNQNSHLSPQSQESPYTPGHPIRYGQRPGLPFPGNQRYEHNNGPAPNSQTDSPLPLSDNKPNRNIHNLQNDSLGNHNHPFSFDDPDMLRMAEVIVGMDSPRADTSFELKSEYLNQSKSTQHHGNNTDDSDSASIIALLGEEKQINEDNDAITTEFMSRFFGEGGSEGNYGKNGPGKNGLGYHHLHERRSSNGGKSTTMNIMCKGESGPENQEYFVKGDNVNEDNDATTTKFMSRFFGEGGSEDNYGKNGLGDHRLPPKTTSNGGKSITKNIMCKGESGPEIEEYFVEGNNSSRHHKVSSVIEDHSGKTTNSNGWVLLRVEIIFPATSAFGPNTDMIVPAASTNPIGILGNFLASIFMIDKNAFMMNSDVASATLSSDDGHNLRSRRCFMEPFCFDALDNGSNPASICRLLSAMLDFGINGNAPFQSLGDVIEELESLTCYPKIFLYDPGNDFTSSTLHFGHKHYGRSAEMNTFLEAIGRSDSQAGCTEVVFISGQGGCGKSHLAQRFEAHLIGTGWIAVRASFDRGSEKHGSQRVVSALFDALVANIASNSKLRQLAAAELKHKMGPITLDALGEFLPSMGQLLEKNGGKNQDGMPGMNLRQLSFLFSGLLEAMLSLDRRIMFCIDNLQWCDTEMLNLIKDVAVFIGEKQHVRRNFLIVGTYRDIEVTDSHPLYHQIAKLQKSDGVNLTELNLPSLSRQNLASMLMTEMRLPKRLVTDLSDVIYKKTSGHALFVVQLLNSLVRDSTIAYSPRKRRFDWNEKKLSSLKTLDSVAGLIVSNLRSLQPGALFTLRILACFGTHIGLTLVNLLDQFPRKPVEGMTHNISNLIDEGILERNDGIIQFAHDLIHQEVLEGIQAKIRNRLYLDLGTFIGYKVDMDKQETIDESLRALQISGNGPTMNASAHLTFSLVTTATDQIDKIDPDYFTDPCQRRRFATWNLKAGTLAASASNFQASLYYCQKGIEFLGDMVWIGEDMDLSLRLSNKIAYALYALGRSSESGKYAGSIIERVSFEDSLSARLMLIRSYECNGNNGQTISMGVEVLRKVGIELPDAPDRGTVESFMNEAKLLASQHSFDLIPNLKRDMITERSRNVQKIMDAVTVACYQTASPYLPLVASSMVSYSLKHGVCDESAHAFAIYAYFVIILYQRYNEARKYGNIAFKILESARNQSVVVRARTSLIGFVSVWFLPLQSSARHLHETYKIGMAVGDVEGAMYAMSLSLRFSFFGGEQLSILSDSYDAILESMVKYSNNCAKYVILDKLLIDQLVGNTSDPFAAFNGMIMDEHHIELDAKTKKNTLLLEAIHHGRYYRAFYRGDYEEAGRMYDAILTFPTSKTPKIRRVHGMFFWGLIAFHFFRQGKGEEWQQKGKAVLDQMETMLEDSSCLCENKVILLRAEYLASVSEVENAVKTYKEAIQSARDHSVIHEQGLAYECMGHFLESILESKGATQCFKNACECYSRWGARVLSERVRREHGLDSSTETGKTKKKRSIIN